MDFTQIQFRTSLNIDLFIKKTLYPNRLKFAAATDIFQKIQNVIKS